MAASNPDHPKALSLTIAISTLGDRLHQIKLPPAKADISYVILAQRPPADAEQAFADRSDVRVHRLDTVGVANSRNAALDQAQSELILFGDDDVVWNLSGIMAARARFEADPEIALVLARRQEAVGPDTGPNAPLTRFNSGRAGAPEIMVRRAAIALKSVRFDTDFGLGAKWPLGEEYVFLADALAAGLKGVSTSDVTCSHPHESTGHNWSDAGLLEARQAVLRRVFGVWAIVVRPAYALRHRRKFGTWSRAFGFALGL